MFRSGERRFLFICNFGAGIESVAQLVEDVDLGGNLIRKVSARRLLKDSGTGEDLQLEKPREIKIRDIIKDTFKAPEPRLSFNIVECYGHEYFKSKDHDEAGLVKYHSVSYWKLCNGRSLYKRWLTGDVLPPAVAVARMVRQILSTLHHLYTAGEKPVYHGDLHFGNIWIHWREGSLLPDFYIGDFADAGFFDSGYHAEKRADTVCAPPLKDLHKFCRSLDILCDLLGTSRGHGNPGAKALRRLSLYIADVLVNNRHLGDFDPPPNLKPLIRLAQNLEDMFGEGGEVGETDSAPYVNFVTGERIGALMAEGQKGLVVFASKADALRPGYTQGMAHVPRVIHGPWQLVRAPDWVPVEGDVTHHRPNRNRAEPGEDLSTSKKLTGDMFLGSVFIGAGVVEPYIGDLNSDGSYTSSCQSDSQPNTPLSSQANSRAAGDGGKRPRLFIDASLRPPPDDPYVSPETEGAQSPSSLVSSMSAESFVILEPSVRKEAQGPQDADEPSPAFSWTKGDDADFEVRHLESDEPDDWGISLEFHDECEARIASHRRRLAVRAKASPPRTQVTVPTISVIAPAENKLQHWHTMLHGAECKCADHVWQAEMEAMFMHERVRRARGGLPKEADWSFREPEGCVGGLSCL
jgi:hypothetical protein